VKDNDLEDEGSSGARIILAVASGIVAIILGVVGTYLVMTGPLGYKQEPKESVYDDPTLNPPRGGGPGGGGPGMGGKGKAGKGKAKEDQPGGASRNDRGPLPGAEVVART